MLFVFYVLIVYNIAVLQNQKTKRIQTILGRFDFNVGPETPIPTSRADSVTKAKFALRIGSQNTRKMQIDNISEGCQANSVTKDHKLDFGLFQETNKNWSTELYCSLPQLLFLDGPAKMIAASEPAQREGHLPGGCLIVAKGDHAGRFSSSTLTALVGFAMQPFMAKMVVAFLG